MHAGLPEPAARRCSIASPALFDPLARCRSVEVDGPYLEYAPKQFCIKMVFSNPSSGHRTSSPIRLATDGPDHFWRAAAGQFEIAPKFWPRQRNLWVTEG